MDKEDKAQADSQTNWVSASRKQGALPRKDIPVANPAKARPADKDSPQR